MSSFYHVFPDTYGSAVVSPKENNSNMAYFTTILLIVVPEVNTET